MPSMRPLSASSAGRRPWRTALSLACLAALLAAGCIEPAVTQPPAVTVPLPDAEVDGKTLLLDVPVPVVLVGFEPGTAAALQAELEPMPVQQEHYNHPYEFPPGLPLAAPGEAYPPLAIHPNAVFEVREAPAALAADLRAELEAAAVGGLWSANLAEDRLAEVLPAAGFPLDPSAPSLVLLHLGSPGYRYEQTNGYIERVRVFGERMPLLALDVSAPADPWAGDSRDYSQPLGAGTGDLDALAEAARDAASFRLLQGAIYPITLRDCHAVTLVVAARAGSVSEVLSGAYADAVDVPMLQAAFTNATHGTVHVDLVPVALPHEDPGLEAALRAASAGTPGGLETLRYWAATNWDTYWVPHEGCEAYVSFLVAGDAADMGLFGIAMYDVAEGHRVSISVVPDLTRMEESGPLSPLNPRPASRGEPSWGTFLFAHETGHLLGQRHPHDISLDGGDYDFTFAWSSVWSAMSYQPGDRMIDFGAIDRNNHLRNRAAEAIGAHLATAEELPDDVMRLLQERKWDEATRRLIEGLPTA